MGLGIDLARDIAPEHAELIDNLKEQMLLVLLKRLGGSVDVPVAEVDDTGQDMLLMSVKDGVFHFETSKKS